MYLVWHANPQYGPVHLGKVDLADGFYREWLTLDAILMLVVIFPKHPNEEQMVALPFSLPMGWVESVPYFCTVTKMIADLANGLPTNKWIPPHLMEELANTPPPLEEMPATLNLMACLQSDTSCDNLVRNPIPADHAVLCPLQKPVWSTDIYLDNFIMAIQGSETICLQHLLCLLYSIDAVFRPIDQYDSEHCKPVLSKKKALKGNAYLCTQKLILSWMLDTTAHTLELPPHQKE